MQRNMYVVASDNIYNLSVIAPYTFDIYVVASDMVFW